MIDLEVGKRLHRLDYGAESPGGIAVEIRCGDEAGAVRASLQAVAARKQE